MSHVISLTEGSLGSRYIFTDISLLHHQKFLDSRVFGFGMNYIKFTGLAVLGIAWAEFNTLFG